jgi:hypothetical protein
MASDHQGPVIWPKASLYMTAAPFCAFLWLKSSIRNHKSEMLSPSVAKKQRKSAQSASKKINSL